jgi:hypothetical protein
VPRARRGEQEPTASTVRDCLDTLVARLGLEQRAPGQPEPQEWDAITNRLERSVGWVFSPRAAEQAVSLRFAVSGYAGEQSTGWFDRVVEELIALLTRLRFDLGEGQSGASWMLNRQLLAVTEAIRAGVSNCKPGYRGLQATLAGSPWFLADLGRLSVPAGIEVEKLLPGRAPWLQDNEKRYRRLLKTTVEAPLGARIDQLTAILELRRRQLQNYLRFADRAPEPVETWCAALNEVYARVQPGLTPQRLAAEAYRLSVNCREAGLASWADLLQNLAPLAEFAGEAMCPPGVNGSWLGHRTLPALMQGRVARCCGLPFCHAIEPLELITGALAAQPILHADFAAVSTLLEHSLIAESSVNQPEAPFYFDVLRELEANFRLWFDARLLIAQNAGGPPEAGGPSTPDEWCVLLGSLRDVFFGRSGSMQAEQVRSQFLAGLGLGSSRDLLLQLESRPRWVN